MLQEEIKILDQGSGHICHLVPQQTCRSGNLKLRQHDRETVCSKRTFARSDVPELAPCSDTKEGNSEYSLLTVLLQQFSCSETAETSLDPRRRGLHGLLSLPHEITANSRLDLRRRLLLEHLSRVLPFQERFLRLGLILSLIQLLIPLILVQLLLLLLVLRLTTTLRRRVLQLLAYAISTEVGLDLRRCRVGLHRVDLLLRRLRHERSSDVIARISEIRRSSALGMYLAWTEAATSRRVHATIACNNRCQQEVREPCDNLFTEINFRNENNCRIFPIVCK